MGLDLLNTQAIDANVVDPMLDRLKAEIVPALEAVIQRRVDSAIEQASKTVHEALVGIQSIEDRAVSDAEGIIATLDGWTVDISLPPTQVGPVTIRLNKPKAA
jgi:hypothetical protein